MKARSLIIGTVGALAVLGLAAAGVLGWYAEELDELRRAWVASQALTESEQAQLTACEDPGWSAMTKVLEQDLPTECGVVWFAEVVGQGVKPRGHRRTAYLTRIAVDGTRSRLSRFRAASALRQAERPWPPQAPIWLRHPELRDTRAGLYDRALEQPDLLDLLDLPLRWEVQAQREVDGEASDGALDRLLRVSSVYSGEAAVARRERLAEQALGELGLTPIGWAQAVARHQAGRPLGHLPVELASAIINRGEACAELGSPSCVLALADLMDRSHERLPAVEVPLLAALWEVEFPGSARAILPRLEIIAEHGAWVEEIEPDLRPQRLRALLTEGDPDLDALAAGVASCPAQAVLHHTGSPWVVALTGLALGELAEVEVEVGWSDGLVYLRLGQEWVVLDSCGADRALFLDEAAPEPWPVEAVFAQAALEVGGAAGLRGEERAAARLIALARRVDPIGTGTTDSSASESVEGAAGVSVAAVVREVSARAPMGAQAAREERATQIAEGWRAPVRCEALPEVEPER